MHEILLSRGRGSSKSPGRFRRSQNWIGGTRPGNALFVPPPPQRVEECMGDLERFLHDETPSYPSLIKAALAHVQFETIHPFLDGNGRLGRLLISFVLHHEGVLSKPLLYLSLYFKQQRQYYYELLDRVRREGDWECWLDFFLEGVEQTAADAVERAQKLVRLFKEDEERLLEQGGRRASTIVRCFQALCHRPVRTIKDIQEATGLSYPAVSQSIEALRRLAIVDELTGRRRNRVFAYRRYLELLNEGMEPL